ncbi:MAG: hypothetical protein C0501_08660 [Isosphaera sp.]|nr:hypothetical protein [Isosphaera sp.]
MRSNRQPAVLALVVAAGLAAAADAQACQLFRRRAQSCQPVHCQPMPPCQPMVYGPPVPYCVPAPPHHQDPSNPNNPATPKDPQALPKLDDLPPEPPKIIRPDILKEKK